MTLYQGYIPTPSTQMKVLERILLPHQGSLEFADFNQILKGHGKGKLSTPYKSVMKFFPKAFEDDAQKTGDCTSHGTRNAADISRAVEIDIGGELEAWIARGATEAIYRYRGHRGQGMNPGLSIEFITKYGLLLRQKYPFADLSKYNVNWAMQAGVAQDVKDEASKHPCEFFLRVRTVEDIRDAIASGFGVTIGSKYGNNGVRDSKGVSRFNDSWNHQMCFGAADDLTMSELHFLILNSWGIWNSGGMPDWGPIPGGSFLVPASDVARLLRDPYTEVWAVGNVKGFPLQDLPDYGFSSYL